MDGGVRNRLNQQAKQKGFRGDMFKKDGTLKKSYKEFYKKKFFETPNLTSERTPPLPPGMTFNPTTNSFVKTTSLFGARGQLKKKFRDRGLISTREGFVDYAPRNKTISGKVHYVIREYSRPGRQFKDKAGRKKRFRDYKATADFTGVPFVEGYQERAQQEALKELYKLVETYQHLEIKEITKLSGIQKTFGQRQLRAKDIRLKNLTLIMDGEVLQPWEAGNNRCVPNYLNHLYGDNDHLDKKFLTDDFFDECFDHGWRKEGVSATEISNWCRILKIKMIALDQFDKVILIEQPDPGKVRKVPTLIFKIHNEHIYPIEDDDKRFSISCSVLRENEVHYVKKPTEEKPKKSVRVEYVGHEDVGFGGRWNYMCQRMVEKGVEVLNENIDICGQCNLKSFILDGTKYVFDDGFNCFVKEFYDSRKVEWDGTHITEHVGKVLNENLKNIISKPNHVTNQILMSSGLKDRTHIDGNINDIVFDVNGLIDVDILEQQKIKQYDIKKCHSSIITDPIEPWMIISWKDNFRPFRKGIRINLGLYYLETDDKRLFIGNNIYSSSIVHFGLDNGIITEDNIKYYLHASDSRDKNLFEKTFNDYKRIILDMRLKDKLKENPKMTRKAQDKFKDEYQYNEFDIAFNKLMNNTTSGMLGKTTVKKYTTGISLDINEAFDNLCESDKEGKDVFRLMEDVEKDGKKHRFHIFGNRTVVQKSEHNLPFYIQILDQQLIKLYSMCCERTGSYHFKGKWRQGQGEVLWRNIDCCIVKNPVPFQERPKCLQKWGDTVEEDINVDKTRFRIKQYHDFDIAWEEYVYSKDWFEVKSITSSCDAVEGLVELYNQSQGCCLEGVGGAGKSYVLKEFRRRLGWDEVAVVSFTGISSLNIRGKTFHSTFRLDLNDKIAKGTLKHLKGIKAVLVDEGSMVSSTLMKILRICKDDLKVPIYFFLDWRQLPPIERGNTTIMKNNERFIELCDGNYAKIKYNSQYGRYDDELYNFTEKFDCLDWFFKSGVPLLGNRIDTNYHITATNRKRRELNEIVMKREWEKAERKLPMIIDPTKFFTSCGEIDPDEDTTMEIVIDNDYDSDASEFEEEEIQIELYEEEKEAINDCNMQYQNLLKSNDWTQNVYFFEGLKCVGMRTNKKLGIINGEQFEVVGIGESKYKSGLKSHDPMITLRSLTRTRDPNAQEESEYIERFPNCEIKLLMSQWFSYLAPGYAMTCHKWQSQKIPEPFTIWEVRHPMVTEEWIYTALTRAGKFSDINCVLF
jgi:hypothetical protein